MDKVGSTFCIFQACNTVPKGNQEIDLQKVLDKSLLPLQRVG